MGSLLYIRLIGYTAGTLLQLFWMVVILGYRRQRNFERVFFFLCLALFLFYAGSLLALNSQIHYLQPPIGLNQFGIFIISAGLCMLPPLLLQELHFNFVVPGSSLGEGFAMVLGVALAWCAIWQWRFTVSAPDRPQRFFHATLLLFFTMSFLAVTGLHLGPFH